MWLSTKKSQKLLPKFLPSEKAEDVRREFEGFVHHWAQTSERLRQNPPRVDWELGGSFGLAVAIRTMSRVSPIG